MVSLSSGCGLSAKKEEPVTLIARAQPVTAPAAPLPVGQASPIVTQQLKKAAELFERGMLLTPDSDNAYIRYRAALMLDSSSVDAKSGLNGILVHEAGEFKQLLESSKFDMAKKTLQRLVTLFGSTKVTDDLRVHLDLALEQERKRRSEQASRKAKSKTKQKQDDRIVLDASLLSRKDPAITDKLGVIARQIQEVDKSVLIYARSDAEGRWIYQQMRKAAPNYRIRGDIRIGRPGIKLLSAYD